MPTALLIMDVQQGVVERCADGDEEVHRVLLGKVFPRQATVITTDQWAASLTEGH